MLLSFIRNKVLKAEEQFLAINTPVPLFRYGIPFLEHQLWKELGS